MAVAVAVIARVLAVATAIVPLEGLRPDKNIIQICPDHFFFFKLWMFVRPCRIFDFRGCWS